MHYINYKVLIKEIIDVKIFEKRWSEENSAMI